MSIFKRVKALTANTVLRSGYARTVEELGVIASRESGAAVASPDGGLSTHHNVLSRRFTANSDTFFRLKKSWTHEIVLNGLTEEEAETFSRELFRNLKQGRSSGTDSYQESIDRLLLQLKDQLLPRRDFVSPTFGVHELRWDSTLATSQHELHATVSYAQRTGVPLMFGYESLRYGRTGLLTKQTRVHRIYVKKIGEKGFFGYHPRGYRSYSWEHMRWAVAEGGRVRVIADEPVLYLELNTLPKLPRINLKRASLRNRINLHQLGESKMKRLQ